jgi:hypothetical protein
MTKFAKAGKTGCSDFLFRTVRFRQFQNMKKAGAKLGDLKIQGVLKQEGGLKGIKGSRWTKIKQEIKVTKNGPSGLSNRTIRFSQNIESK